MKFQKADALFADKKYEEAAELYVEIVDRDPHGEDADKALNNAAVAYENVKRYAGGDALYERIVNEYPNSKFVDDALFRTAVSYQKAFEFDKAAVVVPAARRGQALRRIAAPHRRALQRRHHPRERSELRQGGRAVPALRGRQVDQARGRRPRRSSARR